MNDNLKSIILEDERIKKIKSYQVLEKPKDPSHFERRKQQRAITEEMISLCIAYGQMKRVRKAITYSILDKSLIGTPYIKYIESLRGLRVVLDLMDDNSNELGILTVYWLDKVKKKPKRVTR